MQPTTGHSPGSAMQRSGLQVIIPLMRFRAVPQQDLGDDVIALGAGQVQRGASLGVCGVWIGVEVVEQGHDGRVLLVPDGGQQGVVDVAVRVVVLERAVLEVQHDRVDAGQVLEALFDVVLLPDLLVESVLLVNGVRVLGVHGNALGRALARDTLAVILWVVGLVLGLLPLEIVLLWMVAEEKRGEVIFVG